MRSLPFSQSSRFLLLLTFVIGSLSGCASAITIGQTVTVFHEPDDFHARERMYLHEEIHKAQYKARGTLGMLLVYAFSGSRRVELEAEAYAAELCYVKRMRLDHPEAWQEGFTRALRSYAFPAVISEEKAGRILARAYQGGAACPRLLTIGGRGWVLAASPMGYE